MTTETETAPPKPTPEQLAASRAAFAGAYAYLQIAAPAAEDRVYKGLAMTMLHHHEDAPTAIRRMRAAGWAKDYPATFARLGTPCAS